MISKDIENKDISHSNPIETGVLVFNIPVLCQHGLGFLALLLAYISIKLIGISLILYAPQH